MFGCSNSCKRKPTPPSSCNLLRWLPRDFPAPGHPGSVCVRGFWSRPTSPSSPFHLPAIYWTFKHSQVCRGHFLCPLGLWDQNLDPHTHLVDGNCWPGIRSGGLGMEEAGIRRAGRRVISPEQPSPSLQPPSQILSGSVSHPG